MKIIQGNIFDATSSIVNDDGSIKRIAVVNPVNCMGVMGKGLALEFKTKFPTNFQAYKNVCSSDELFMGRIFTFSENNITIFNFPTKLHWKDNSNYRDIERGLNALVVEALRSEIKSIAIPALGCGLGGLDFGKVSILIQRAFSVVPGIDVSVYVNPQ